MSFETQNAAMLESMDALLDAIVQRTLNANEIYVDSTGSDNNPGTAANPVQTFAKAVSLLKDSTFNVIYLKSGEAFDTLTGRGGKRAFEFESGTSIILSLHGFAGAIADAPRATLTLSTEVSGGENTTALELNHLGDMYFGSRYVDFVCEAPAAAIGVNESKIAFLRKGVFKPGGTLGVNILSSDITTATEGAFFANLLYGTILDVTLRSCDLHGPQPLIRNAASSCARVVTTLTAADVGTVVLDDGTLGENVQTNTPSITL